MISLAIFFSFPNQRIVSAFMSSNLDCMILQRKQRENTLIVHVSVALACRTSLFKACSQLVYIQKVSKNCLRYFSEESPYVHSY